MRSFWIICFLGLLCSSKFAAGQRQHIPPEKVLQYETAIASIDTTTYSSHKVIVANDTLAAAFYMAMTYFPELHEQKIYLQYGKIRTSMAALPRIWSIFRKRDYREYKVIINGNMQKDPAILVHTASFNAMVGVMGHELAHILDYSTMSGLQIMWMGIRYLNKNYRKKIEWQTDTAAIAREFGWQLFDWIYFVAHEAEIDDTYRRYKLDIYMNPEDIYEIITKSQSNNE